MTNPMIQIDDEIREMTDAEFAVYEAEQATYAAQATEEATKAAARQAVLDRLGLTEEEAALLLK